MAPKYNAEWNKGEANDIFVVISFYRDLEKGPNFEHHASVRRRLRNKSEK